MATAPDKRGPLFFGFLAALNVALVVAGGAALTGGPMDRLETVAAERFAAEVDAQAAAMATGMIPYAANPPMIARHARASAPKDSQWALAVEMGGAIQVLAASDPSLVGKKPSAELAAALAGSAPGGRFEGMADGLAGDRYTSYHLVPVLPAPPAPPTPKPTPVPTPRLVEREVVTEVPQPGKAYTIKAGDTLYQISRDHYGDERMFRAIWEANR
ncbi:MAG: LysM peptidoglycan-binding domain-containing protein, partial [Candidatus Sericytochromatia bacterium]